MSAEITRHGSTSCAQHGIDPVIFQELEDRLGEIAKSFFSERARFWSSTDEQVKNLIQTGKDNALRARVGSLPLAKAHEYSLEVTRLQNTTSLDYQTVLSEIKSISQLLESNVLVSEAIKAGPQFYRVLEVNGTLSYIALAPNGKLIDLSKWTDEELKAGAVRKTVYKNPQDLPLVDSKLPQAELIKLAKQCGPQYWREVEINGTLSIVFRIVDGRFVDVWNDKELQKRIQQLTQNPNSVEPKPNGYQEPRQPVSVQPPLKEEKKTPITRERIQTISTACENTYSTYSEYVRQDELSGKDPGKHLAAIIVTKAKIEKFYAAALRQGKSAQELSTLRTGIDRIAQLESLITAAIDRYDAYENLTTPQKVDLLQQTILEVEQNLTTYAKRLVDCIKYYDHMSTNIDLKKLQGTMDLANARIARLPLASKNSSRIAQNAERVNKLLLTTMEKHKKFDEHISWVSNQLSDIESRWSSAERYKKLENSKTIITIVNPNYYPTVSYLKDRVKEMQASIKLHPPQDISQLHKLRTCADRIQELDRQISGFLGRFLDKFEDFFHTGTYSKCTNYTAGYQNEWRYIWERDGWQRY